MKKVIALSAVLVLGSLGAACDGGATNNSTNNAKPATNNAAPTTNNATNKPADNKAMDNKATDNKATNAETKKP